MCRNKFEIGHRPAPGRPRFAKREGRFPLGELLVALAIFGIVTGFAYRGLNAMLESREALERESRKWRDVALFVGRIERDLGAVLARRAIGVSGTPLAPVSSVIESTASPDGLALTRSGSPLQESALAAPQRLAYRLRDGNVERLVWTSVDASPREEPAADAVLKGGRGLRFRFLNPSGEWPPRWGLPGPAQTAPPAPIQTTLTPASAGTIGPLGGPAPPAGFGRPRGRPPLRGARLDRPRRRPVRKRGRGRCLLSLASQALSGRQPADGAGRGALPCARLRRRRRGEAAPLRDRASGANAGEREYRAGPRAGGDPARGVREQDRADGEGPDPAPLPHEGPGRELGEGSAGGLRDRQPRREERLLLGAHPGRAGRRAARQRRAGATRAERRHRGHVAPSAVLGTPSE